MLYGSNKFMLETRDDIQDIRKWLVGIGATNRSFVQTLSIDFCHPFESQAHFTYLEHLFYQINMPSDSDRSPEENREVLDKMEKHIKTDILSALQLLAGAGSANLTDLTLEIPADDQGRQMEYRYDNDFYFRGDLLENDEVRKAI